MPSFESFTLKSNGLVRDIRSECGVSTAFLPQYTNPDTVKILSFTGLWDTGATSSVIDKRVIKQLDLKPIGKTIAYHANGSSEVNVYAVNIFLPNNVAITFVRVTEGILEDIDVLIGMDIIIHGDFSLTNYNGKSTFSFRTPSLKEVDFVEENKKLNERKVTNPKIGPNELCPCGSGVKYKRCHGKRI